MAAHDKKRRLLRRKLGFIFQDFGLFDHLTVKKNIALAPKIVYKQSKNVVNEQVKSLLKRVGLEDKINAYPSQLSGGQKQRIVN